MVKPISREPTSEAAQRFLAHFHVAENIFQHHDGVVHHEADRENQRHHGQVVQAVVQQVHHREGADDGKRQRQAGNDRGRDVAQEQEDDHDHQAQRQQHGELDVVDTIRGWCRSGRTGSYMSIEGGSSSLNNGSSFLMSSVTSMVLVPGWRWMASTMARSAGLSPS